MPLPTFPYSPLPAGLDRTINWGENITTYDSGERQGDTPFTKPLLIWSIPVQLMTEIHQSSLWAFVNDRRGQIRPFLIKDAYDFRVNSALAVSTNATNGSTLFLRTEQGYMVRPDTATVGSLWSALSGYVKLGNEFTVDQDSGVMKINTIAANDYWRVQSMQYFRKANFNAQYQEHATLWNIFSTTMQIVEVP